MRLRGVSAVSDLFWIGAGAVACLGVGAFAYFDLRFHRPNRRPGLYGDTWGRR